MDEPVAFLDGEWIPAAAAKLPVGDAGLVLGAAVAEQLRCFAGKIFRLDDHLRRLEQSLRIVGVDPGMSIDRFAEVARELVAKNHPLSAPGDDLGLSIFVTPGAYPAFAPPGPARPTVCMHTYPLPFRIWAEKYRKGQALVITEIEQVSPQSWPPQLKCRSRMHYYLADRKAAAIDPGARALLLDRQGFVLEASTANILIYKAGEGLSRPPDEKVLPGISLAVTVELAGQLGISTTQRELVPQEVTAAGEVLLTSTPWCLLPVTRLGGHAIGNGGPGEVFRRLSAAWSKLAGVDIAGQAERFAGRL